MENTQVFWILYVIMLSLNCVTAEEEATTAKRNIFINTTKLIQHIYFENALSQKIIFFGKEVLLLFPQGMRDCNSFWVKKNKV